MKSHTLFHPVFNIQLAVWSHASVIPVVSINIDLGRGKLEGKQKLLHAVHPSQKRIIYIYKKKYCLW